MADLGEAVAVVPLVGGNVVSIAGELIIAASGRGFVSVYPVPLTIIEIIVRAVKDQLVPRAGRAVGCPVGARPVALGVVGVGFV